MINVITISGKARHGKDTTAQFIKEELERAGKKVLILRFADYLKMISKLYFGWSGEKDVEGRTILQKVGTDIIRNKDTDFWVSAVYRLVCILEDRFDYFLIPDTRFPNEVEYFKRNSKNKILGFSIKVIRESFDNGLTEEQKKHPSETALDDYCFDSVVQAKDLSELKEKSRLMARFILLNRNGI